MKRIITSAAAPAAVGPYSQAIEAGMTIYVSGQLPIDPHSGQMPSDIASQTRQALQNVEAILREAGYTLCDVVKATVLLTDIRDFGAMNEIYGEFFTMQMPARVCYQVAALPRGASVEIDVIAVKNP